MSSGSRNGSRHDREPERGITPMSYARCYQFKPERELRIIAVNNGAVSTKDFLELNLSAKPMPFCKLPEGHDAACFLANWLKLKHTLLTNPVDVPSG